MGAFTLTGKVNQVGKDGVDVGIDQDKTVATGWTATLVSNYPKGVPVPDGSDIDYITTRTITLLSDGSITEDGVNPGVSLTAHDPDLFSTALQWTIKPGVVTLTDNKTLRPKPWTFNAPLAGVSATLGGLTPVAGMPLLPVPGAVPWDDVTGKPAFVAAGDTAADARAAIGAAANLVPTAVKTSAYTAAVNDLVVCDASTAFTVTLPSAPADKSRIAAKMVLPANPTSAQLVTIAAGGSDVFNKSGGSTTLTLTMQYQAVVLQYKASGAIWYVVSTDVPLGGTDSRYVRGSVYDSTGTIQPTKTVHVVLDVNGDIDDIVIV